LYKALNTSSLPPITDSSDSMNKRSLDNSEISIDNENIVKVSPNPFQNEIKIMIDVPQEKRNELFNVNVYNIKGQVVTKKRISVGRANYIINSSGWNPGIYLIQVMKGKEILMSKKIIKN
jgi:hypothetical protein